MKSLKSALLLAALASTVVSCSNDDDDKVVTSIEGEYTFAGTSVEMFAASTYETISISEKDSTATNTKYASTSQSGTASISATNFTGDKLSFIAKGSSVSKLYTNGEETEVMDLPINYEAEPVSSVQAYKLVGMDSIYFGEGFLIGMPSPGTIQVPKGAGATYKFSGDTLVITSLLDTTIVQEAQDERAKDILRVKMITRFKKK
ncbi:hypothetical protein [Chitinophaga rhizophila]|uniref:Lipocalin-like domain-containing protein n=1 Tax=Chitinophaga rhizophila TaxID=2866212 RepID=A0ABS7GBU6_9BACT|nr:hypothetical protein [Chitinophaga rhizophila]MBW8684811.1 hypothetical protein [Chitinophaga rhizophila]